ncbi:hypothetical protein HHL22_04675 [Hymenobacter sp. RP-2-7]|uniref:Uncharacterized protein n=1 Tax=Hymenobacter polaris TaxID=2682546 RepID=A0A7Y0ABW8_9BACT|nr:hypothetical protein [Hymenobacter polaris]NML64493.1 hypothetical protein [Hymenobacter polaris]
MPDQPTSLAETALNLLAKLSGGVELNLSFDQVELQVPNQQTPGGPAATWKLNGALRIRTKSEPAPAAPAAPTVRVDPPAPSGRPQPSFGANTSDALPRG